MFLADAGRFVARQPFLWILKPHTLGPLSSESRKLHLRAFQESSVPSLQAVIPALEWADTTLSKPLLIFVIVICLAIFPIFLLPSSPLIWLAGISFGYAWGYVITLVGMALGMSATYFIGRRLLHDRVQAWINSKPRYVALLRAANQVSGRDDHLRGCILSQEQVRATWHDRVVGHRDLNGKSNSDACVLTRSEARATPTVVPVPWRRTSSAALECNLQRSLLKYLPLGANFLKEALCARPLF